MFVYNTETQTMTSVAVIINLNPLVPLELCVQVQWASLEDEQCSISYSLEISRWQSVDAVDL